jgi:hypothetical protein
MLRVAYLLINLRINNVFVLESVVFKYGHGISHPFIFE